MNPNKEINIETLPNISKSSPEQNKAKSISSFTPLNEKVNPNNIISRQNSAFKNLKNEIKSDTVNIYPSGTPRKHLNNEYFSSIISPFKDNIFVETPFKHGNYNLSSPDNLRFNSPMNNMVLSDSKNFFTKNNHDIQGKKIDFSNECIDIIKLSNKIPQSQNFAFNNKIYNNNNNINTINNNINNNINLNQNNSYINNNNMSMNIISVNNTSGKCTCSKTGCKKKYCACFSRGKFCDGCECKNCENIPRDISQSLNIQKNEIEENPKLQRVICNCTKSNCMKKYCECFKQGFNCNSLCRCLECKNKIYINNINNDNITYNLNNINNNINNDNTRFNNNNYINNNNINNITNINTNNNDSINTNNFYNYALHNNINNNIINNNIINNSYIPETFGKSLDFSNPINFQPEAFGICIKKFELKLKPRKIDLNEKKNINMKEAINNNFSDINETPKFSNKKRLRTRNDNSTGIKTCPTTNSNSANKLRKAMPLVNKYIKKKRLQLS